jgi:hypothetical protein
MDTSFFFSCAKSVVCGVPNIRKTIAQWKKGGSIQEKSETPGGGSHGTTEAIQKISETQWW